MSNKLSNERIKNPPSKKGNAPIGDDGHPVELHHTNQEGNNTEEMTRTDHRGGNNFKENHSNTGQSSSKINREKFKQQRRNYWAKEWELGRFINNKINN